MLIGQSIIVPTSSVTYYTPWMPRQGDVFSVQVEVINLSGAISTFDCKVRTKNNEDADPTGATGVLGTMTVTTTAGTVTDQKFAGALELVRYEYTVAAAATRWVHFRATPPIWFPN